MWTDGLIRRMSVIPRRDRITDLPHWTLCTWKAPVNFPNVNYFPCTLCLHIWVLPWDRCNCHERHDQREVVICIGPSCCNGDNQR
jgi:hypothetical protein